MFSITDDATAGVFGGNIMPTYILDVERKRKTRGMHQECMVLYPQDKPPTSEKRFHPFGLVALTHF